MMKNRKSDVHGIKLSSEEAMRFEKYVAVNGIAMNTKTAEHRKAIVNEWFKKQSNQGSTESTTYNTGKTSP